MKFAIFTEEKNRYGRPEYFYRAVEGDTEYLVNFGRWHEISFWFTATRPLGSGPGNWTFDTSEYKTKEAAAASLGGTFQ